MYLIYVDDYGNTGKRLDDPKQPLFMLFSMLIHEKNWCDLEGELKDILTELTDKIGIHDDSFEFHAANYFSIHNQQLQNISLDERAQYAFRLAESVRKHGGRYLAVHINKANLAKVKAQFYSENFYEEAVKVVLNNGDYSEEFRVHFKEEFNQKYLHILEEMLNPYVMCFGVLMSQLNAVLGGLFERGIVIIDYQQQFGHLAKFKTFRELRHPDHQQIPNLLEQPMVGDGKVNTLLQIADMVGYFTGMYVSEKLGIRSIPPRHQKTIDLLIDDLTLVNAAEKVDFTSAAFTTEALSHVMGIKATSRSISAWLTSEMRRRKTGEETPEGLEQQ